MVRTSPHCVGEVFTWDAKEHTRRDYNLPLISENRFLKNIQQTIDYNVIELNQQVSIVPTKPKDATKQMPLIILPHGGPNSVYSVDFILYVNALSMLGYAVASSNYHSILGLIILIILVNYTGSIGFGNQAIAALEGNIGIRDVEDCFVSSS